jgi:cell division protein ZapA (FtsZ GTPase activity inhibitor)
MKTYNSSVDASFSPIKVDIFNSQYTIKPTENLSAEDIRELASYVDQMMQQVSKRGTHDKLSVAIMVALNIAAQMHEEQKRAAKSIRQLIDKLDTALSGPSDYDRLGSAPTLH